METKDYWDLYKTQTAIASENVRKLAFAGIAIVWLFRVDKSGALQFAPELLYSIALFSLCLLVDTLHYLYASLLWKNHALSRERLERDGKNVDSGHPDWIPRSIAAFFWVKTVAAILGFVCIGHYVLGKLC